MNNIKTIHQFTPTLALGDSVSNGVLYTQKLLKNLGFISEIYIANHDIEYDFKHNVYHISEYVQSKNQVLFYHHSIGHQYHDLIMKFSDKKILIYHNITPPHFFKNNPHIRQLCILGREQLASSSKYFFASTGDSKYNCKELEFYNYPNPTVLTLLLDLDKQVKYKPNEKLVEKYYDMYNILFVGRVVSNKAQHQLIDVMFALKQKGVKNFKLHIVGGSSQDEYMIFLKDYVKNLKILVEVTIVGKVNDEDLAAYYKLADLYISLSEHEGFGMPLIEAMKYDIPVLAFNAGGVSTTVPNEGLLENKAPSFVADKIIEIQNDPYFRVGLIKKQRKHLESFSYQSCINNLSKYLNSLDIKTQDISPAIDSNIEVSSYQIEGPFDSSYSLAIVNKDLALALNNNNLIDVKLYSTEGTGDFKPNLEKVDKTIKIIVNKEFKNIDITIRNLYPPRTNAMQGFHKIVGPYGWEESKFPSQYVDWFNTKLSMIFAMSGYVKNVLKDNGVNIPIVTTGIVVENILRVDSLAFSFDLPTNFKLLHISSCFPRKGVDKLLEAFDMLDRKLDISLIIKTFPNQHNTILKQLQDQDYKLESIYELNISLYVKNKKQILLINRDIPQSQIRYLYENSNLLVAPSFGEGFGLPMAEAMLLNLPVLTTAYGGQTDFCTPETSWLIDFNFESAKTHMQLKNSIWTVPKVDSLKHAIEYMYNLPKDKLEEKTIKAKSYILKKYSSTKIASNIQNAIKNYPSQKPTQKIALFSTYNTKCGIALYSSYLISSFKDDITIFANQTDNTIVKDNKNIIRCWVDSRDTKNIDSLKKELIKQKTTKLIIQYNFSFLPLHLLEELIEFCVENFINIYLFLHSTKDVTTQAYTDSFSTIATALKKATKIYIHTLSDINYLMKFGIYKNTYIFTHGINYAPSQKVEVEQNSVPILATFGFLLPQKGIFKLIDILQVLHKKSLKVKLLLLTSIHPAPISKNLLIQLKQKIQDSGLNEYITLNTEFLEEQDIVYKLSNVDKILFLYENTQESSSAAVRMGLLAKKEVITTPLSIFDDIKSVVTQTKDDSIEEIVKTIETSLKDTYDDTKLKSFIEENSWQKISKRFRNSLI